MRKLLLSVPLALCLTAAVAPAAHANPVGPCDTNRTDQIVKVDLVGFCVYPS